MEDVAANSPSGTLVQLAVAILKHTTNIETYLQENGLPNPSFRPGAPPKLPLPPALEVSLNEALAAMDELNALLLGSFGWLKAQYDLVSLHAIYRYNVPALFPVGEEISVGDIAKRCNANEDAMSRILKHATANYLLLQPRPGYIAHSACSAMLSESPSLMDWIGSACEDMWPAAPQVVPALTKWPGPTALPQQTGHNLAERTNVPFFETLSRDSERTRRFASAMGLMQDMPGFEPSLVLNVYDWAALRTGIVVDVGGSSGTLAIALTNKYPSLRVIVQDMPHIIEEARSTLPPRSAASSRVTLQAHDFFTPQTIHGADVYILRLILHDWSDAFSIRILRQLIPALKPGARILLNDFCIPSSGIMSRYEERQARLVLDRNAVKFDPRWCLQEDCRCQDIAMMAIFNSKERSETEWAKLVSEADFRFHLQSVVQLPSSPLGLLELVWNP
ncbi:hypothetical protein AAE478_008744 [Parahypoxylon ruwenzoriense]